MFNLKYCLAEFEVSVYYLLIIKIDLKKLFKYQLLKHRYFCLIKTL